jgi:hypothetical protein
MQSGIPRIDWGLVFGTTLFFVALARTQLYLHQEAALTPVVLIGQNQVALWLYAALMFPGTLLHEISHALAATAVGINVQEFNIAPTEDALGSVQIEKPDVVRRTIIGLAPLAAGTCVVLGVSALAFDLTRVYDALMAGQWDNAMDILAANLSSAWGWIAVYVVFVVSANMFPSLSDVPRWLQIAFLTLPVLVAGAIDLNAARLPWLVDLANTAFSWLLLIFGLTLAIDLPILLLLTAGTEAAAGQVHR